MKYCKNCGNFKYCLQHGYTVDDIYEDGVKLDVHACKEYFPRRGNKLWSILYALLVITTCIYTSTVIWRQARQIENYKAILNALPVDTRNAQGGKCK